MTITLERSAALTLRVVEIRAAGALAVGVRRTDSRTCATCRLKPATGAGECSRCLSLGIELERRAEW